MNRPVLARRRFGMLAAACIATAHLGMLPSAIAAGADGANPSTIETAHDITTDSPCPIGSTRLAPVDVISGSDGSLAVIYLVRGVRTEVRIPREGFSPLTATARELANLGMPERPSDTAARAQWAAGLRSWKRTTDATLCEQTGITFGPDEPAFITDPSGGNGAASYNWAGNALARAAAGTYVAIQGDIVQPTKNTSCTGAALGNWIGLGGYTSQKLIQAGTAYFPNEGTPRAWYEYLAAGSQNPPVTMSSVVVRAGDRIHAYVAVQKSTGQTTFYLYNTANGTNSSVVLNLSVSTYYDGSSAEWIDERPSVGGAPTPLGNFGSAVWTNVQAQNSVGSWLPFGASNPDRIKMLSSNDLSTLAYPNAPSNNSSFTDVYYKCS